MQRYISPSSRVRGDLGHRGVLFVLLARAASATSSEAADLSEAAARRAGLVVDGRTQTPKRYDLFTDLLREVSALRGKISSLAQKFFEAPDRSLFATIKSSPNAIEIDADTIEIAKKSLNDLINFGAYFGIKQSRYELDDSAFASSPVTTGRTR